MTERTISIVISVFNEAEGLPSLWEALSTVLSTMAPIPCEVLWVNDGNTDRSQVVLAQITARPGPTNVEHRVIGFSRNFGHEAAMIAGGEQKWRFSALRTSNWIGPW